MTIKFVICRADWDAFFKDNKDMNEMKEKKDLSIQHLFI